MSKRLAALLIVLFVAVLGTMFFVWVKRPSGQARSVSAVAAMDARGRDTAGSGDSDDNPEPSLASIYADCIAAYDKTKTIDSGFGAGADTFSLHVRYYCLRDSGIVLPKRYAEMYGRRSFVTHNYACDVRLERNGSAVLVKSIRKRDFGDLLHPELREYGALLDPEVRIRDGAFEVDISISIPLTDVGMLGEALIDTGGKISYQVPGS